MLQQAEKTFITNEKKEMQEEMDLTGMFIAIDAGEVEGAVDPKTGKNITVGGADKLPKASDSCVADAAVIFSVVFATPVEIVDESVFVAGKTTVSVHVDNLSLEVQGGKHPWVYKRMNAAFEANISESVEQALQDCSRVTKASQELGLRIAHATEVVNRQQQQQASGGGRK